MSMRAVRAALALGLGLAGIAVGVAPASAVDGTGPVRVAIVVPIVAPANSTGVIDGPALEQYTRPLGLLTRQLDAVAGRPVTIAIDPMIIASIRILGSSAPESATSWLARLGAVSNPILPLAWADADLTLATQAGSPRVVTPLSLDFALDPALFAPIAPEETATPTPTPTADPVDPALPPLPSTDDLLAWPYSLTGIAWPRENTVVASDLAAITDSGYTSTILSSTNLTLPAGAGAVADVDGSRILVSDDAVSTALRAATHTVLVADQPAALASLTAAIATAGAAQSGDQATLVATLDRTVPTAGAIVGDVLSALDSDPTIELVPLAQAMGASAATATVTDEPQVGDRVTQVAAMLSAETADTRFASVAAQPEAITGERRLRMLALLSSSWGTNPAGWLTEAESYLDTSVELRNAVQIVESSSINLLADRASLTIDVSNTLNQAVTVYITVRPDTGILAVQDTRVELTIEPNSQGQGRVPVQAISNGEVEIAVSLASSSGVPIGAETRTEINVQAGWETPIVIAFGALVVAVFAVGIVRNIVRRRRPSHPEETPADD